MSPTPHPADVDAARHRSVWLDLARSTIELVGLLLVVAMALRAVDELPGMAAGVVRGVRRVDSIAALERRVAHKMAIPAYFPDTLEWPPYELLEFGGTSASMAFRRQRTTDRWMIVAMAVDAVAVAAQLLPPATALQSEATIVRDRPATVERLRDADGNLWYQVTWRSAGASRLVRYRGTLDEVMLIANSLDERGR
jgi:hypothetical protein